VHLERQPPNAVINVAEWSPDQKFPIFPVGSKPKRAVLCPEKETLPFLRPGHRYLFKAAEGWQAHQLWSEVFAYELSRALGLNVPPALVAVDSRTETAGVLIEFFYGYPGVTETSRLVHAADYMQDHFIDGKKGRPHGLRENLALCRKLGIGNRQLWWGQALVFDALIGNTDRHPENWGFLFTWRDGGSSVSLAPLYDNGTSLGYNLPEAKLATGWDQTRVEAFVARGTHDCGWSHAEDGPAGHVALTARFATTYAAVRPEAERLLALTNEEIEDVAAWCEKFTLPVPFSAARSAFIVRQVAARRDALAEAIAR
jgi:hypothetical protein